MSADEVREFYELIGYIKCEAKKGMAFVDLKDMLDVFPGLFKDVQIKEHGDPEIKFKNELGE